MILADTSVWVDHFRKGNSKFKDFLLNAEIACHPFIIGELACGNLKKRSEILTLLNALPMATVANHAEVMTFIEKKKLMARGIGLIDVHLLASATLSRLSLWTLDKKLRQAAQQLKINF